MSLQVFHDVLTPEQLLTLSQLPEVAVARARIDAGAKVAYFSVPLTDSIRSVLLHRLGLDLSTVSQIPMRWIRGDTAPHIDTGRAEFSNTYLMYMNDSPGEFIVSGDTYPIAQNMGFIFNEGLRHETLHTGSEPRLLLGPMSEAGFAVGNTPIQYFSSEADALAYTNILGGSVNSLVVGNVSYGSIGGITSWRIASNSSGPANQALVYTNGQTLDGTLFTDFYYLYPAAPCFLEGSKILCEVDGKEEYVPVEQLKKGTLVKTVRDGFKRVALIGSGPISNPGTSERTETRLYKCSKDVYPELTDDLYVTGCHSILVDTLTDVHREQTTKILGRIFVTDRKYRLMACVDERAEPWVSEGTYTVWHFALDHENETMNYGVYANGGLLVETCCLRFLRDKSNMTLQ